MAVFGTVFKFAGATVLIDDFDFCDVRNFVCCCAHAIVKGGAEECKKNSGEAVKCRNFFGVPSPIATVAFVIFEENIRGKSFLDCRS